MITAVDTSVLLDVFLPDPQRGPNSRKLLMRAFDEGALVISEVVYAELVPQFDDRGSLDASLATLGIRVVAGSEETGHLAGERFSKYRRSGGPRTRILTDFLIGAHASHRADRFLTRDRGLYRTYFPELETMS